MGINKRQPNLFYMYTVAETGSDALKCSSRRIQLSIIICVIFIATKELCIDYSIAFRREEGCETYWNNNITHYLCQSTFIHKSGPSPSRVYCIFAKSTNSNFQFPYCSSHGQVTFLKYCYWLVGQKYNTHVTLKNQSYE